MYFNSSAPKPWEGLQASAHVGARENRSSFIPAFLPKPICWAGRRRREPANCSRKKKHKSCKNLVTVTLEEANYSSYFMEGFSKFFGVLTGFLVRQILHSINISYIISPHCFCLLVCLFVFCACSNKPNDTKIAVAPVKSIESNKNGTTYIDPANQFSNEVQHYLQTRIDSLFFELKNSDRSKQPYSVLLEIGFPIHQKLFNEINSYKSHRANVDILDDPLAVFSFLFDSYERRLLSLLSKIYSISDDSQKKTIINTARKLFESGRLPVKYRLINFLLAEKETQNAVYEMLIFNINSTSRNVKYKSLYFLTISAQKGIYTQEIVNLFTSLISNIVIDSERYCRDDFVFRLMVIRQLGCIGKVAKSSLSSLRLFKDRFKSSSYEQIIDDSIKRISSE